MPQTCKAPVLFAMITAVAFAGAPPWPLSKLFFDADTATKILAPYSSEFKILVFVVILVLGVLPLVTTIAIGYALAQQKPVSGSWLATVSAGHAIFCLPFAFGSLTMLLQATTPQNLLAFLWAGPYVMAIFLLLRAINRANA